MKLSDAPWRRRSGMKRLLRVLGAGDGETRFVGGCVRDTMLGGEVSDVDLATRLRPEQVIGRLSDAGIKAVPTGVAHGTVTAVLNGQPVEVTTLRRDVATDGRRAAPESGEIFDYFEGVADLEARRVRFIGDPLVRIAEDHLRILRFFRFHARFAQGPPDEGALAACTIRRNDLMALSRERVADELLKLLALPDPSPTVRLMLAHEILAPVLPEIRSSDLLDGLVRSEGDAGITGEPIRRLAALLPADPELAAAIAARLRLSKRQARRLTAAADRGLDAPHALAYRFGPEAAVDRFLLSGETQVDLKALQTWQRPRLPLSGGDLIAMGLEPGPVVAETMQAVESEWIRSGFPADRAQVRALARRHVDQALRARA